MSQNQTVFNPGPGPAHVDAEGRVLGGGEFAVLDVSDPFLASQVEKGLLVVKPPRTEPTEAPVEVEAPPVPAPKKSLKAPEATTEEV